MKIKSTQKETEKEKCEEAKNFFSQQKKNNSVHLTQAVSFVLLSLWFSVHSCFM